jgi:hypothetical protein
VQPLLGVGRERERAVDRVPERIEAEHLDRHPQLQRAEAARQLDAPVEEVDLMIGAGDIGEVLRVQRTSAPARRGGGPARSRSRRLPQPFVWVDRDRVDAVDTGQGRAARFARDGRPTICGVVDPLDDLADLCGEAEMWLHADATRSSRST